jgi:hypothetical protein
MGRSPYAYPPLVEPEVDESIDTEAGKIAVASFKGEETLVKKDRLAEYIGGVWVWLRPLELSPVLTVGNLASPSIDVLWYTICDFSTSTGYG